MRTLLGMLLLVGASIRPVKAQSDSASSPPRIVYTLVERHPEYPGGMKALSDYLRTNLRYPQAAREARLEGRVFVNFTVTDEGNIEDVVVLKGLGSGTDEEAVRLMKNMPKWVPGKQGGKPVNVKFNLPISFVLEGR